MARCFLQALARGFALTLIALALTSACVKLPRRSQAVAVNTSPPRASAEATPAIVSINKASAAELDKLPGVGPALAARIVEWRKQHGSFRRVEHLLMVRGISERRFRELRPFITTE
jgi:competence protein ComEA